MTCKSMMTTLPTDIFTTDLLVCVWTIIGCILVVYGAFLHLYLRSTLELHRRSEYKHLCRSLFVVSLLCYVAIMFLGNDPCIWIVLVPFFILRGGMAIVIAHETGRIFAVSEGVALLLVLLIFLLLGIVAPYLLSSRPLRHTSAPSWMYFLESQSSMLAYVVLYVLVVELHWNTERINLYFPLTLFLVVGLVLWHLYMKNTSCYQEPPLSGTVIRFVTLITLLADSSRLW
jgi:hypothetical protein